jgi:hypothetical protein
MILQYCNQIAAAYYGWSGHARDNVPRMFEKAAPIEVISGLEVEEFAERYVRVERPVIVRGAVKNWPPSSKWTPDYLKAMSGTRQVKTGVSADGDYVAYADRLKLGVEPEIAFAQAIDAIFSPTTGEKKRRIHQERLDTWGPLNDESPPPPYVLRKLLTKNIWMGSAGNVTKTHYDTEDNINVQLIGRKEIVLFPATQLDELYPRSALDYMSNFSRVDIEAPDLARYPLFSRATAFHAILEPGDFIYIPIYWWHHFRTLEASLNVNFWWQASPRQAMRRHGVRFWPRMIKDGYFHWHVLRTVRGLGESLIGR